MAETEETDIFWGTNPNILISSLDFFPVETMTYSQKLNAITRAVIVLGIILFLLTQNVRLLAVLAITVASLYFIGRDKTKEQEKFTPAEEVLKQHGIIRDDDNLFDQPDPTNPFSNPLIGGDPTKKPAPPAFSEKINEKILKNAKTMVQELNPGQPDIADKLFQDLGEQYVFEQSMRQFNSNPSTTVANDQTGFAEFCYGSMVSCREGNLFACSRNLPRYNNY
jgi:hypothetical protein